MKGKIHSFESFGTLDGPGIRFVIFMQGCALKCKYCQNRDTWATNLGKEYTVDEVISKIMKYKNYIFPKGGVTVSGGEPLLQASFLIELFKKLKQEKIHTCIDTSGSISLTSEIKQLIDLTDLFLLDIKCINDTTCKELTGVSNTKEIGFAKYLNSISKKVWIRQVLVPGITDKKEDLVELSLFLKSLKNVEKFELLKYHDLGKYKWEKLGLNYPLINIRTANDEDIIKAKKIMEIV